MPIQNVSDEELDNARHEMIFCFGQIRELEPWARQITEGRPMNDTLINGLLNNKEIDQWDAQFRGLLLKTIQAQVKYIDLLEKRIGK
jgi:hypothetical protein